MNTLRWKKTTASTVYAGLLFLFTWEILSFVTEDINRREDVGQTLNTIREKEYSSSKAHNKSKTVKKAVVCAVQERLKKVQARCEHFRLSPTLIETVFVAKSKQVAYCQISKNGCTSWKVSLTDRIPPTRVTQLVPQLHQWAEGYLLQRKNKQPAELLAEFNGYFKFTFWRHPFARLYSFYKNKILMGTGYYRNIFMQSFCSDFNAVFPELALCSPKSRMITFQQFVSVLAVRYPAGNMRNRHWNPQTSMCDPCAFPFDFLGRVETLSNDAKVVVARAKLKHYQILNLSNITIGNHKKLLRLLKTVDDEFRQMPDHVMKSLEEIYRHDFNILGYGFSKRNGLLCDLDGCC